MGCMCVLIVIVIASVGCESDSSGDSSTAGGGDSSTAGEDSSIAGSGDSSTAGSGDSLTAGDESSSVDGGGGSSDGSARITLAEYNAIKNGMTVEQVNAILAPAPMIIEYPGGYYGDDVYIYRIWRESLLSPNNNFVVVKFTNDVVSHKEKGPDVL
jgi:hypothetical protein